MSDRSEKIRSGFCLLCCCCFFQNYNYFAVPKALDYIELLLQIYLYEYDDDMEPIERPRHICPHAVVSFKFTGHVSVPARRKVSSHSGVAVLQGY